MAGARSAPVTAGTRPEPAAPERRARPRSAATALERLARAIRPAHLALAAIVGLGLALRLHGIDHGLPFVYSVDEAQHFTSRAVAMFRTGSFNPGYFDNPSALTYLIHVALRFAYGGIWPFGQAAALARETHADPVGVYVIARTLATVLCMLAIVAMYAVGRRLWGNAEGLAGAAILAFAFLPVAYSRFALTDVGVLLPVTLAIYGTLKVRENGRRRYYLLAGAAIGLAIGFKYTAGLTVVPFLVAVAMRARHDRRALVDAAIGLLVSAVAFALTTPFFFLEVGDALGELGSQSRQTGVAKPGQVEANPLLFYLGSLSWGLGVGAALAATGGLAWQARRDPARGLLLALLPVLLVLYLSGAERFFARWLLPCYPVLALLAGVGLAALSRRLARRAGARAALLALLLAVVLAQPLAADVRTARVLAREDTRQSTRDFLTSRFPPGTRMVIEPAVPRNWYRGRFELRYRLRRPGSYVTVLHPRLVDAHRRTGHCIIVTMSTIRGRAEIDRDPQGLAYYRRLERESRLLFRASPYRAGVEGLPFDFEWSHLYYPAAYVRPGPDVRILGLDRCRSPHPAQARPGSPGPAPPGRP